MTNPDGPQIRIGNAERERAAEVLREAAADGRLTFEELDERIGRALAARTRSDLVAVLADLVPRGPLEGMLAPAAAMVPARELKSPGQSWEDPLVISAGWEDEKRLGQWAVPPFLELNPVASNVKLYFTEASYESNLIDVVCLGGMGDILLVVPAGWGANVERVAKGMGSVKSTVADRPEPGHPLLVLRGKAGVGTVKVRYPNKWDTWVIERDREKRRPPQVGR